MPSGRTHDSITLWSLPLIAGVTFERTQNASLTLLLSGGYLFSGLMFGPDLDVHSQQYKRWGILRWIWLPYRRSMRHRSVLSHGIVIGTLVRIIYLLGWIVGGISLVVLLSAIAYLLAGEFALWAQFFGAYWQLSTAFLGRSLQQHYPQWIALILGLELGALSHSLSDWVGSRYKRLTPRKPKSTGAKATNAQSPAMERSRPVPSAPPPPSTSAASGVELPKLPPDSKFPPFKS